MQETSIELWGKLYETATRIKERKPWEDFWEMDLIGIQEDPGKKPIFFNILGQEAKEYGIVAYEGYEGLNDFFLLLDKDKLNVSSEYVLFSQTCLAAYWGSREEMSEEQRQLVKTLGYKYHGKDQWLYFMSHNQGYFPCMLNEEEVVRMSHCLTLLEQALECWAQDPVSVDFEHGNIYLYYYDKNQEKWVGREQTLPFTDYQISYLELTDKNLIEELKKARRGNYRLEAELSFSNMLDKEKPRGRAINRKMCLIADADSGRMLKADLMEQEAQAEEWLIQYMVDFILGQGAPSEIRVSNGIVAAILEQICSLAEIKITRAEHLPAIQGFLSALALTER